MARAVEFLIYSQEAVELLPCAFWLENNQPSFTTILIKKNDLKLASLR